MPKAAAQRETRAGSSSQTRQGSSSRKGEVNPVREKRDAGGVAEEEQEEEKGRLEPSPVLTGHQMFYLFFLDGIGAMILSGGVNFALAYVMYTTQDTTKNPIRLFQLPNTLAGDAAVTIIIQCILTWFVEMGLVSYDLSNRSVQPIGFIPEPSSPWLRSLFYLTSPPSESKDIPEDEPKSKIGSVLSSIVQQALRGFMLAVLGFLLLWGPSIGLLTVFGVRSGGDYLYQDRWVPQAFKGILGGVLGLLTTPPMAAFWLMKAGWEGNKERTEARASRRSRYTNAV